MWPHVNILRSTKCEFRMYVRIHCIFCKKHILYYKKNKCFPSELILTNWKFFFFTWLSVFKQKYETYTPPPRWVGDWLFIWVLEILWRPLKSPFIAIYAISITLWRSVYKYICIYMTHFLFLHIEKLGTLIRYSFRLGILLDLYLFLNQYYRKWIR